MQPKSPSDQQLKEWQNDPSNWVLGIFYFNKKDKRIMAAKRISMLGWTPNFANPFAIPALIAIFLVFFLLVGKH
jgi:uncharacterized membrane protein